MNLSIYTPNSAMKYGALRIGFTGAELVKLIGQEIPPMTTYRANISVASDKRTATITFEKTNDKGFGLSLRPQFNVKNNPHNYTDLGPVICGELNTPVLSVLGVSIPFRSESYPITNMISGNTMTFLIPEAAFAPGKKVKRINKVGHRAANHTAARHVVNASPTNIFGDVKTSLDSLNMLISKVKANGQNVTLSVNNETGLVEAIVPSFKL